MKRNLTFEALESRAMLAHWSHLMSMPVISIANSATVEGNSGQHDEVLLVSLSRPSWQTITATVETSDSSATAGVDYLPVSQQITFLPGQTSLTVSVPILGDALVEPNETFSVALSAAHNAWLGNTKAFGTVLNDDTATPPPVPPSTIGTNGPVGPQPGVTAPLGAILLSASNSTATNQAILDNAAAGATFFFAAGTYYDLRILPKTGQSFSGEFGAVMTSATQFDAFENTADNVTVKNLTIDGYVPDPYNASVNGGVGWQVLNCEVRNSATWGIWTLDNSVIDSNYVHHNHKAGIAPHGNNDRVTNNEVAFNNWLYEFDPFNEAGGSKFWACTNLLVANNNFHDNGGYGIWCDGNCSNVTIQDNWVHDEGLSGIQYEISGQALIQGNLSENNGLHYFSTDWPDGDGIRVKTSHDVTVQYNIVRNNKNGIVGESFSTDAGTFANNVFQYNAVTMLQGTSGIWWQSGSFPSGSTWIDNTYTLSGIAALAWSSGTHLTLAQWQALGNQ